jgi:hypothetical protein
MHYRPYGTPMNGPPLGHSPGPFAGSTASGGYARPPHTPTAPETPTGRSQMTSSASSLALAATGVGADTSALLLPSGELVSPLPTNVTKAQFLAAIEELEERANECELALARARHEASHKGAAHAHGALSVRPMSEIVQEVLDDNRDKSKASVVDLGAVGVPLARAATVPLVPAYLAPSDLPAYEENKRSHALFKATLTDVIAERRRATHAKLQNLALEWRSLYHIWATEHGVREQTSAPPSAASLHALAASSGAADVTRIALGRTASNVTATAANGATGATNGAETDPAVAAAAAAAAAVAAAAAAAALAKPTVPLDLKSRDNKYMVTVVDVPPMILDEVEQRRQFLNENNLIADPVAAERERKMRHAWSNEEKRIFIKKYLLYPKQFHKIASFLENRTTADVIEFYFTHKLTFNLKRLLTEHQLKRRRRADDLDMSGARRSSIGGSSTTINSSRGTGATTTTKGGAGAVQVVTLNASTGSMAVDDAATAVAKRKRDDDDTGGVAKRRGAE